MKLHLSILLLILAVAIAVRAQTTENSLAGDWVGNIEASGRAQFIAVSLTENDGRLSMPLDGFDAKFSSVRMEGGRVRFEVSSIKLVLTGTIARDEIVGDANVPGTKGTFHLVRTQHVRPEVLATYTGAYRFRDGRFLVIDSFPDMPNMLLVTEVKSGEVRAFYPQSDTQFIAGAALFVPWPMTRTITFRTGARVEALDLKLNQATSERAIKVRIHREEVRFQNGDVKLAGMLLTPESNRTKHPAVVFTHGGGPALREFFWGLGYLFAARGVAVLTYDKRGAGESAGNWREASFEDLADDAVAAANLLQSRVEIDPGRVGFWGLSQGGWIAPLAASRFHDSAFAIALSGGGLSPSEQELFDTEYELRKAGFPAGDIQEALTFQRLKNEIVNSNEKWNQYSTARVAAKEQRWFRFPGIDVRGPEKLDDPAWTRLRRFYFYDPAATLRSLPCPLLAIFGELDTPNGVKANIEMIRKIMTDGGKHEVDGSGIATARSFTIKVYPNGRHNLMEVAKDNPNEFVRLKRFPPSLFETMVDWTLRQKDGRKR